MHSRGSSCDDKKKLNLPHGYKFVPTGAELLEYYLVPKLKGEKLPSNYIMDVDNVYEYEPSQLTEKQAEHVEEVGDAGHVKWNEAYLFTKAVDAKSSREWLCRATPKGYWKVHKHAVKIDCNDGISGYKTKLVFYNTNGNLTEWKMLELRLYPTGVLPVTLEMIHSVVCKVKLTLKEEDDDENAWRQAKNFISHPQFETYQF